MKEHTAFVLVQVTPTHRRGMQTFETREEAEARLEQFVVGATSETRYEIEEVQAFTPGPEPPELAGRGKIRKRGVHKT